MKTCDKCGSEQKDENRFCSICGNRLQEITKDTILCINCAASISEKDENCPKCGHAVMKGNVQLQKKVMKIEDTIEILERKINLQSHRIDEIVELLEKDIESKPEVTAKQLPKETPAEPVSEYKIPPPVEIPEPIQTKQAPVKITPPVSIPPPVEVPPSEVPSSRKERTLDPPTLPVMLPKISVKDFITVKEIKVERPTEKVKVEKQTVAMRLFNVLINQVQPIIASALLIGGFILLAVSLQLSPVLQGLAFGLIGIIAMGMGHVTIGGRMFGIKFESLRSREVGIFLINFGMGLGLGVAWVTSGNQMLRLIPSLVYIGIPALLGYIHRSDVTKSLTVVAVLGDAIVLSTSGLPWIMEFGGILPIGTVLLYLFIIEKQEISWTPVLILMAGGPLIVAAHFVSTGSMLIPALGIVLSAFPAAYFLNRGYVEVIKPYYYSIYTFFFLWPVVAFSIILNASTQPLPFDPAILFSGLAIAFHLSTSVMHDQFEGSEILREVSLKIDHLTKIYVPLLGTLVIIYQQILLESANEGMLQFALTFVFPQFLLTLLFAAYAVFVHWKKFWTTESSLLEKWASILVLDLAILVSTIRLNEQISELSNPDIIVGSIIGITSIMPILGAVVHLFASKWIDSDELLKKTSIIAIANGLILTLGFVEGVTALGITFSSLLVFLIGLLLPKLDGVKRKGYYQLSLIGNFFIVVIGQLLDRYSRIEIEGIARFLETLGILTIGPFFIFAIYTSFAGFSFLFLNKIIPERTIAEVSYRDVMTDPTKISAYFKQKAIEYQELIFSALTNFVFIVFLTTNGFVMGSNWSYLQPTIITVAFMLVNTITIYNTRGRHWGTLVPAYLSFLFAVYYVENPTFNSFIQATLIPIYLVSVWISHKDEIKQREGYLTRIFFRDAIAWIAFTMMLFSNYLSAIATVAVFVSVLTLSLYQTFKYEETVALGFVPVLIAAVISRMPSGYDTPWATDLNYFMGISVLLAFAALHFLRSIRGERIEDRSVYGFLTFTIMDNIRKVLPVFSAIFLIRPETLEGLAISHMWFFLLSILIIGIIETTGFDRKKIVGVLPLFILNFLSMPVSTELWQVSLLFATFAALMLYTMLRSIFNPSEEEQLFHTLIGILNAITFYAFAINTTSFVNLIMGGVFLSLLLYIIDGIKNKSEWNALPISVFTSLVGLLTPEVGDLLIGNIEILFNVIPYIGLSAYLFAKLFYRQDLAPQSISVVGFALAVLGWTSNGSFGFVETVAITISILAILLTQFRNFELVSSVFVQIGILAVMMNPSSQKNLQEILFAGYIAQMILYRIFKGQKDISILEGRMKLYQYVLLPVPFISVIFMDDPLSRIVSITIMGIMSVINETIEDHNFKGMSAIILSASAKIIHLAKPENTTLFVFETTEGMVIAGFIILSAALYLIKYLDVSKHSSEKQIMLYLTFIFVSLGINRPETTYFMTLPLAVLSLSLWNKDQKSMEDIIDVSFLSIASLLFTFDQPDLSFIPLMFFFVNLILNSIRGILRKTESSLIRMVAFGAALLIIGMILGDKAKVWTSVSDFIPQIILDFAWTIILGFWLVSINVLVSSTSELKIEGLKNLSASGLSISTTIFVMALASVMWINLTNLVSLFVLLSLGSIFLLVVVVLTRNLTPSKKNDLPFIFGSILTLLLTLRLFDTQFSGAYQQSFVDAIIPFTAREALTYMIFLPISLTLIPLSLRLVSKEHGTQLMDGNKLDIFVFLTAVTSLLIWAPNYGEILAGVVAIFWSLFVLSASIGKRETSLISSILMSITAFIMGMNNAWFQNLSIAGEPINGGGTALLIVTALMFLYLWKVNFENAYNACHDIVFSTTVGTSVIALILMADFQTTAGRAILFNGMVLLSVSIMAFAVKFSMRKYEIVATAIIYGALILGIGVLIVLGSSGTLNLTVTMITLFSGGLGFLVNIGLQNINRLAQKARFLQIFAPREVSNND